MGSRFITGQCAPDFAQTSKGTVRRAPNADVEIVQKNAWKLCQQVRQTALFGFRAILFIITHLFFSLLMHHGDLERVPLYLYISREGQRRGTRG